MFQSVAMPFEVVAGRRVDGRVRVPSSKSVTQRYLALALVGRLALTVRRPLLSEDPRLFLDAMRAIGFEVALDVRGDVEGDVRLEPGPLPAGGEIFCGNGGTMFRFLTAALTTVPGHWRLDGVERLRERPIGPLIDSLRALGAVVDCPRKDGYAPLEITGATLRGGRATLDAGSSSQYLSAILIAAQAAAEPVELEVGRLTSSPYVDLTREAIRDFGGAVTVATGNTGGGQLFRVAPSVLRADSVTVEGDYSAAAYPAAAAALSRGRVVLEGLRRESAQGDRRLLALLDRMGATVTWNGDEATVTGGSLVAVDIDLADMPDQVPTVAALAPFARGRTRIRNVAHLRIKESDRLAAMATELVRVGADARETADGLDIPGVWAEQAPPSNPVVVETHGDHRIAMAMALVGLRRPGLAIAEPEVVSKSYPDFWRDWEHLLGG